MSLPVPCLNTRDETGREPCREPCLASDAFIIALPIYLRSSVSLGSPARLALGLGSRVRDPRRCRPLPAVPRVPCAVGRRRRGAGRNGLRATVPRSLPCSRVLGSRAALDTPVRAGRNSLANRRSPTCAGSRLPCFGPASVRPVSLASLPLQRPALCLKRTHSRAQVSRRLRVERGV